MKEARYDVAIVGGGPAGLACAISALENGARRVVVIERKKRWGWPVRCAEYVPLFLGRLVPLGAGCIANRVNSLHIYLEGRLLGSVRAPGFILKREVLEGKLAGQASRMGASLLQPATVLSVGPGEVVLRARGRVSRLRAGIIVGADGPRSVVRGSAGIGSPEMSLGLQRTLPMAARRQEASAYFSSRYGTGYAWCFPRGDKANVGIALDEERIGELEGYLDEIVAGLAREGVLATTRPIRRTSGFVPVSGPVPRMAKGCLLLVGGAAGLTNPFTGSGVFLAVSSGQMAGRAIGASLNADDPSLMAGYESSLRALYGDYFRRALEARESVRQSLHSGLEEALRAAWRIRDEHLVPECS